MTPSNRNLIDDHSVWLNWAIDPATDHTSTHARLTQPYQGHAVAPACQRLLERGCGLRSPRRMLGDGARWIIQWPGPLADALDLTPDAWSFVMDVTAVDGSNCLDPAQGCFG